MLNRSGKGLKRGDSVGVLVSSSPIDEAHMEEGHRVLAAMGLKPKDESDPLFGRHYMAKEAERRVQNLMDFLQDKDVAAVWLARGGYGANLMLSCLDGHTLTGTGKPLFGSSDGCYLLWYLMERWRVPVYLAPMIYAGMTREDGYDESSLNWAFFRQGAAPVVGGCCGGSFRVRGRLHGGCLSMLSSLVATPYMPNLCQTLLIVEDVNERPYRLERMMWQLMISGSLEGVAAVLFGQFPGCFRNAAEKAHFLERMNEMLTPLAIPYAWDFPLGHAQRMVTVPLGGECELTAGGEKADLRMD